MRREDVIRIRGCLINDKDFIKIRVESMEDLEKLAKAYGVPIIDCKEGYSAVVDPAKKFLFIVEHEKCKKCGEERR